LAQETHLASGAGEVFVVEAEAVEEGDVPEGQGQALVERLGELPAG
jgi:hypothetical protein